MASTSYCLLSFAIVGTLFTHTMYAGEKEQCCGDPQKQPADAKKTIPPNLIAKETPILGLTIEHNSLKGKKLRVTKVGNTVATKGLAVSNLFIEQDDFKQFKVDGDIGGVFLHSDDTWILWKDKKGNRIVFECTQDKKYGSSIQQGEKQKSIRIESFDKKISWETNAIDFNGSDVARLRFLTAALQQKYGDKAPINALCVRPAQRLFGCGTGCLWNSECENQGSVCIICHWLQLFKCDNTD